MFINAVFQVNYVLRLFIWHVKFCLHIVSWYHIDALVCFENLVESLQAYLVIEATGQYPQKALDLLSFLVIGLCIVEHSLQLPALAFHMTLSVL